MKMPLTKMYRAVVQKGRTVSFTNAVGGFVGGMYEYQCDTEKHAEQFADYLRGEGADGLPTAVTREIMKLYRAKKL